VLEVIDKGIGNAGPPLLFIHGAWHGAWCWDEHFLDFFADNGFHAVALSLRGHGNSPTDKRLNRCSVADYVDDVISVARALEAQPVVIGHSLGGLIVQKYLETQWAPAGVLLASAPPKGLGAATLRLSRQFPSATVKSALRGDTMTLLNTPERSRETMFSPATPEQLVTEYTRRFQQESRRALLFDAIFWKLPKTELVTTSMLVLGAENDGSFTVAEILATARAYHAECQVFSNMGHDMMLEPGWQPVAEHIAAWLHANLRSDENPHRGTE
jgi:pimeloyl-ACP methyl ester carboxylesterase